MREFKRMTAGWQFLIFCLALTMIQTSSAFFFKRSKQTVQTTENTTANASVNESCVAMARRGDCQFYRCFNDRHRCPDSTNYAINYGFRFCSRFDLHYNQLNAQGKRWLNGTRLCAMEKMLDLYRLDSLSCSEVDRQMKDRQAACAAENGLCQGRLLVENKDVFSDVYSLNRQSAVRFLQTVKQCTLTKFQEVSTWFQEQMHSVEDIGQSVRPFFQEVEQQMARLKDNIQGQFSQLRHSVRQIGRVFGVNNPTEKPTKVIEIDD